MDRKIDRQTERICHCETQEIRFGERGLSFVRKQIGIETGDFGHARILSAAHADQI